MRSRRHSRYTPPEKARRIRNLQTLLLIMAGLVTAYLVFLAMMKGR